MAWRLKLYPNADAAFAAHEEGLPIGTAWRTNGILYLVTPGGLANLAEHSVTGEGETLTVSPSILISRLEGGQKIPTYHGYLENGILKDDCDGRTFPQWPASA